MGKFKINLEVQGFKLNVEGEREDLPAIRRDLQQQLTGALMPSTKMLNGEEPTEKVVIATEVQPKKQRRRGSNSAAAVGAGVAIDLTHNVERYGHPLQSWNAPKKSIWLLFASGAQGGPAQMSGSTIAATFNKYFKEAGLITTSQVNRDLAAAKAKTPSQVSTDVSKTPAEWFLTTEGKKIGEQLVAEAVGTKDA